MKQRTKENTKKLNIKILYDLLHEKLNEHYNISETLQLDQNKEDGSIINRENLMLASMITLTSKCYEISEE